MAHDRHPLDAVLFEQGSDMAKGRVGSCNDDVARHDVGDPAPIRLYEFGRKRLRSDEQGEPPRPTPLGIHFDAPYQVAFADDSDQMSTVRDDRHGTDPILE